MKKKLIVLVAIVVLAATSAMANTEIDVNYYMTPIIQRSINSNSGSVKYTLPSYFGLESNFNFMFGKNSGIFDAGLNLDLGFHVVGGDIKIDSNSINNFNMNSGAYSGVGGFFSIGPVFRFTFANFMSLSMTPGIQVGIDYAQKGSQDDIINFYPLIDFNVAASLNAALKLWLVNVTGFHLGLNLGADVDFPFAGLAGTRNPNIRSKSDDPFVLTGNNGITYGGGMNFRIFAGIAFQFGDRAYDR